MSHFDSLDFYDYQMQSRKTWHEVDMSHPVVYPTIGLLNEAGELAGKIKKIFRDKDGLISRKDVEELKQELGDVLWYLTQICTELDLPLESVARENIDKLADRAQRNVINGDGDDR